MEGQVKYHAMIPEWRLLLIDRTVSGYYELLGYSFSHGLNHHEERINRMVNEYLGRYGLQVLTKAVGDD
jgi:hypothetical protein